MLRFLSFAFLTGLMTSLNPAMAQTPPGPAATPARPVAASGAVRRTVPTRDPHTPGYVTATELADDTNPSLKADGNFIIGPTHTAAPEMTAQGWVRAIFTTEESTDSKIHPGITQKPAPSGLPTPTTRPS